MRGIWAVLGYLMRRQEDHDGSLDETEQRGEAGRREGSNTSKGGKDVPSAGALTMPEEKDA